MVLPTIVVTHQWLGISCLTSDLKYMCLINVVVEVAELCKITKNDVVNKSF